MLAVALPGCASLSNHGDHARLRSEPPSPAERTPRRDLIPGWRAIGKLAVRTGGERRGASFDWRQSHDRFRLRLGGPLGAGVLQVTGGPDGVVLTTAAGERRSARTAEALLADELGRGLPASFLRYWITARAHPGVPAREWTLDESGRLLTLEQHGWRIEYEYRGKALPPGAAEGSLPHRIELRGEGFEGRLVVREWRLDLDA